MSILDVKTTGNWLPGGMIINLDFHFGETLYNLSAPATSVPTEHFSFSSAYDIIILLRQKIWC